MKFCWTTVNVKDLDESLKFYKEIVGLSVDRRFMAGNNVEIAFLGKGETKLELIYDKNKKDLFIGNDISVGFEVKSVDEMMEFLKEKNIKIQSGPFQPNPKIRFIYIKDPNGLSVQLVENIS